MGKLPRPFRDARRFPSTQRVPRTEDYTYDANVWEVSIVQGPVSVAPCQTASVTIRNFLIAVSRTTLLTARGVRWWEHGLRYRRSPKPALPWKVGAVSNLVIFYL